MRYFERLRRSLCPDNGRCGRQPQYGARWPKDRNYLYYCTEHYVKMRADMILCGWEFYDLADGETMGCDYEV